MEHHAMALNKDLGAIYPVNGVVVDYIPMKTNDKELRKDELFHGAVPKYLIMAIVGKTAFHGDYAKNPYNFKHYNLSSLCLKKDREIFPYETFSPDLKGKNCLREYISLYQRNGLLGKDADLPITYEEFLNGYTLFQWNLTTNQRGTNSHPNERANLSLCVDFVEPLPEPANLLLYGVFDGTVSLYANDIVVTHYLA